MKTRTMSSRKSRLRRPRGFALVLVLFACVICALLLIILTERVSVNTKSTSAYSDSVRLRALSEMAVNLVQAQIQDATTDAQTASTALASRNSWASQPGAIRVYTPAGSLALIYKLYSSDNAQTTDPDLAKDVPADWFLRKSEYTDLNEPVTGLSGSATYPILNPNSASLNPGATGIAGGFSINATTPVATGTPNPNAAPMPVRWTYVLADGTLCQLGDARINKTTNPITGRLAYWTDDETTKVNLNTAAPTTANSYWDTPKARGSLEDKYSLNQPSENEYQRYPGHPAMVSLRSILGSLGNMGSSAYYDLTSRYAWGGSQDGAIPIGSRVRLNNKEDRLYATVDELLFKSTPVSLRSTPTPSQVESLKFFLTTNSQAPELNLFGQPRVTIWPIFNQDIPTRRTPFDRLIAFCSTIGGKPYYFAREKPLDQLYDYSNILRNQELYAFLQRLTNTSIPGFGGQSFAGKYGADRDQILTEIFDYIRCANLNETYGARGTGFQSYTTDIIDNTDGADPSQAGAGFVVPIKINTTHGGGRFPAIQGATLWFVRHRTDQTQPESPTNPPLLQAVLIVKTTTPMHGYMPFQATQLTISVKNTIQFRPTGSPLVGSFPGGNPLEINWAPFKGGSNIGRSPGGYDGSLWTMVIGSNYSNLPLPLNRQPVFSTSVQIGNATTFDILPGGKVDVDIRVAGVLIQSSRLTFDGVSNLPIPTGDIQYPSKGDGTAAHETWWSGRGNPNFSPIAGDVVRSVELTNGDARLALMADTTAGDPFSDYKRHTDYLDTSKPFAYGMRGSSSSGSYLCQGATAGSYVSGGAITYSQTTNGLYNYTSRPDILPEITDLRAAGWSGDYDNGLANFSDGPYLNMPDEGSAPNAVHPDQSPYVSGYWGLSSGFFSPLRQIPSAVMFGSLPTGVKAGIPWRTLLFCPNPRDAGHIGFSDPADHLLLDLFRMPVVEPLAISGPASTNGKINMNYAIAPFSYIRRASSWYALLEPMKIMAIPDTSSAIYKGYSGSPPDLRNAINITETLKQFETRFAANDIFHSATEICRLFLVPQGQTLAGVQDLTAGFWSTNRLTGDNSREKPYAELYPKLTTQSNTYSVHMRVQILPKSDGLPTGKSDFEPLAEYRGSRQVERFLNPNNPRFASGAGQVNPDTDCLNELYQFRILEEKQFNP